MKHRIVLLWILLVCTFSPAEKVVPLLSEGDISPSFMLPTLDDKRLSLRDYCGPLRTAWKNQKRHIVIISFMASYCVPCRHEIPQLEAYARTRDEDVQVLFISVDTLAREELIPFADQMKMACPVLLDRYGQVMKKYGVQKLPSLFILDKEGIVRYQNLNGFSANTNLAALLSSEISKIRTNPNTAASLPKAGPITAATKKLVLESFLSGKPQNIIQQESGLSADEIGTLRQEIQQMCNEHWSTP